MRINLPSLALVAFSLFGSACAAENTHSMLLAQRTTSPTCSTDANCMGRVRLPRARRCSNGSPQVPTACCRMNYCGVCWSECGR
ncbi:MAG: hypothetical protein U0269_16105 [Polyangiales bacterium]